MVESLLKNRKMFKYIHGLPGIGKSYLALCLIIVALLYPPPIGLDNSQDLAIDAGAQISPADFDKVDQSVALGLIKLTAKQRQAATAAAVSQRPKVLFTSGINTALDDLVFRFKSIVKTILGKLGLDLICLRMHSYKVEAKDFPRLTAKLGREIERENNDVTSSFLIRLLSKFSGEVDAFEREGRKNRRPNPSVVDKAIELYNADQEGPQETPLRSLSVTIDTRGRTSTVQTSILLQWQLNTCMRVSSMGL